ncbi:hypothetical protein F2Q70_00025262 [Brassica cretica]|uniref:Cytochrome P450 n=1 Tax=Brassica cretica TaxID=69181 RepID=A0A8S9LI38_BRACR|nr:hypothetical protein F2Q70_00025262 [Brassica cretica]
MEYFQNFFKSFWKSSLDDLPFSKAWDGLGIRTILKYTDPDPYPADSYFYYLYPDPGDVHLNPEIYPDPKKFDPSRWEGYIPKAGTFLPFGLGSHLCPGNDLAKLEISIFLHHFLLKYRVERSNPGCQVLFLPHTRPKDNCFARITKTAP